MTHTFSVLYLSDAAFEEVVQKLTKAGYQHAFHVEDGAVNLVDMDGIAVSRELKEVPDGQSES